ncbi:MAG: hypothetical protein V2G33_06090 [bacterium JZ-2024 1]
MRARPAWESEEALEKIGLALRDCGKAVQKCWILHTFLSEVLDYTGPWQLANFLATCKNSDAVTFLRKNLEENFRFYADWVERVLSASLWDAETGEILREFGAA